jgi:hypothetical protein
MNKRLPFRWSLKGFKGCMKLSPTKCTEITIILAKTMKRDTNYSKMKIMYLNKHCNPEKINADISRWGHKTINKI